MSHPCKSGKVASRPVLFALATLLWLAASSVFARALEVRSIVLSVSDLDRSVAFYESALGFSKVSERLIDDRSRDDATGISGARVRSATLRLGDESIELEQYLSPAGRAIPPDSRANDLWFQHFAVVVGDMDRAHAHLSRFAARAISSAPQTIPASNTAAAGIRAFKFRDPDGHPLELLQFPPGKGNPKWQAASDRLFLGIDHTAITVADTERSLVFYRDLLGLRVSGASLNSGPTQEQLDDAPGALVRVTGLRPDENAGPGLEFLQYLTPAGGRPAPADLRPGDLAHARVVLQVDDLERIADQLARRLSFDIVGLGAGERGLLVTDPDGHAVMLVERAAASRVSNLEQGASERMP